MDATLTVEQEMLVETAEQLGGRLSSLQADPDPRGWDRIREVGWCGLRAHDDERRPYASGVEIGLVAESFGRHLTVQPFLGAVLGGELLTLADAPPPTVEPALAGETIVVPLLAESLTRLATGHEPGVAWDGLGASHAVLAEPRADGDADLAVVDLSAAATADGVDASRALRRIPPAPDAVEVVGRLSAADHSRWLAFALATVACELVGVMEASLERAVRHATDRSQFDRTIASFQAVQHLCAEQVVSIDAARSAAYYAAWAVDELVPSKALLAARVAKVYCGKAALQVTEAAIQIHGGMGMTWECDAHRFLRRAILDRQVLGGEDEHLAAIADERMGEAA